MAVAISEVAFEHHHGEALGIASDRPRISWTFSGYEKDWIQRRYELEITFEGEHAEQHVAESPDSLFVAWPARPLLSGERAQAPQYTTIDAPKRPILFRRDFVIGQAIRSARLYATAHGVYEANINGRRVGDHILDPGWSSYNHRLAYQTFDITSLLQIGPNCIGATVAEGWWAGRLGIPGGSRNIWGKHLGFIAQIVVVHGDGSTEVIPTDAKWKANTGGIITSEIYDGEVFDAREEPSGWAEAAFHDEHWIQVAASSISTIAITLVPSSAPPVRRVEELKPISVCKSPKGKTIMDFGQNLVGHIRVTVRGPRGHRIAFQHVEVLEHGESGTRPLLGAAARDVLTLSGEPEGETWEPKFTFHGFRYVEISGWPENDGVPGLDDLIAVVTHTDLRRTGHFECSDPMLNQLHQNIVWSMRGNFLSIPTDCPQRGERLGWTGDIQAFGPTACYLYDSAGLLKDWLLDLAYEQHENGGTVPPLVVPDVLSKSPSPMFREKARKAQAIWGDVAVSLPWDIFWTTGDGMVLLQQYWSMQTWLDSGIPRRENGLWDTSDHPQLADWLDPSAPPDDPGNSATDGEFVANAFLIGMTDIAAKTSLALGKTEDATRYEKDAAALREEFRAEYVTSRGRVSCYTQTAFALAIHFSLFASASQTQLAGKHLEEIICSKARFKIATGFAGTPLISHALTAVGRSQIFYRMLQHRKNPSWLYPVTMGATTMWERWDSMLPDGTINPGRMTSFNHYALGSVADWMHKTIGGIQAAEPGWRKVVVAPTPGGTLTNAKTSFHGPYGIVRAGWSIKWQEELEFALDVTVPPNTSAQVKLPDGTTREVGSGVYTFRCPYNKPPWPPKPNYGAFYRNSGEDDDI
ncbi:alfa-L-rhamnosidase [Thozetella sp. PMI_491]|nr:alfa-L-rhamnosidase [Thozetella sp. PMI_491]